jgi:hypothetical protein
MELDKTPDYIELDTKTQDYIELDKTQNYIELD